MPSNVEKDAVQSRLKALFDAIFEETSKNPEFAARIESILLSPEVRVTIQQRSATSGKTPSLNIVELLHLEGESGLRRELELQTNDTLAKLCVDEGIKKLKEAKSIERSELITLLFDRASSRLKQGEAFTRKPDKKP